MKRSRGSVGKAQEESSLLHKNKLLSVLSDAEQAALYGLPDFDDAQRLEYLALSETELGLALSRPGLHAQVYCVLQIGYFKAKHTFFRFHWGEVEDDRAFVLNRYFDSEPFARKSITNHEHYSQRERVAKLFGYRPWTADFLPQLAQQAAQTVRRDVTPGFVAAELDRLAQGTQDHPAWIHRPTGASQSNTARAQAT